MWWTLFDKTVRKTLYNYKGAYSVSSMEFLPFFSLSQRHLASRIRQKTAHFWTVFMPVTLNIVTFIWDKLWTGKDEISTWAYACQHWPTPCLHQRSRYGYLSLNIIWFMCFKRHFSHIHTFDCSTNLIVACSHISVCTNKIAWWHGNSVLFHGDRTIIQIDDDGNFRIFFRMRN